MRENFNSIKKGMETIIINNQSEMKDTLTEMSNLQGINSRVHEAKNQNSDLRYKETKNTQSE